MPQAYRVLEQQNRLCCLLGAGSDPSPFLLALSWLSVQSIPRFVALTEALLLPASWLHRDLHLAIQWLVLTAPTQPACWESCFLEMGSGPYILPSQEAWNAVLFKSCRGSKTLRCQLVFPFSIPTHTPFSFSKGLSCGPRNHTQNLRRACLPLLGDDGGGWWVLQRFVFPLLCGGRVSFMHSRLCSPKDRNNNIKAPTILNS